MGMIKFKSVQTAKNRLGMLHILHILASEPNKVFEGEELVKLLRERFGIGLKPETIATMLRRLVLMGLVNRYFQKTKGKGRSRRKHFFKEWRDDKEYRR